MHHNTIVWKYQSFSLNILYIFLYEAELTGQASVIAMMKNTGPNRNLNARKKQLEALVFQLQVVCCA